MTDSTGLKPAQTPPNKVMASPAKVLQNVVTKKISGRLTIQEPNTDSVCWRVYVGEGKVHFATSAIGQPERLSYMLKRYCPDLANFDPVNIQSDYQYLCQYWQSGQLSLQQIRKLLFALSQDALVQLLAMPQAVFKFENTVGLDPLLLSVPLQQLLIAPVPNFINRWVKLRPEITSPLQRPFVINNAQFAQLLQPVVKENSQLELLKLALNQNFCLYQVASQLKIEVLELATVLQPLVKAKAVGTHPYNVPEADERPIVACIDDSKTVQRQVKLTLEAGGYRVLGLLEPARALTELVRHKPALVLMDISMPDIDGYELCNLLRQSTLLRNIPIVMLTGRDGLFDRVRARMVGAKDYITKPFEPQHLLTTVGNKISTKS